MGILGEVMNECSLFLFRNHDQSYSRCTFSYIVRECVNPLCTVHNRSNFILW